MAKKKSQAPSAQGESLASTYPADAPWWPADFAPIRYAFIQGAFMVALALVLYFAYSMNGLLPVKRVFAWAIGASNPMDLGLTPDSWDIAVLLWCFFLILGNTLIHPVVGLVSLATLRPWLDGYTFKTDNVYFLGGIVLILALWGVRALFRNEPLRYPVLTLLSMLYVLIALALSAWSVQFSDTYKALLNWTGYVAVFIVTTQNVNHERTLKLVLLAIVLGMAAQAVFAILQYFYVLPYLRDMINQRPEILKQLFGVDHVTPEMEYRFNKNRAFGTVLFPNALAAFLILGIPATLAFARNAWREWRPAWAARGGVTASRNPAHQRGVLASAAVLWFLFTVTLFAVLQFPSAYADNVNAWYLNIFFLFALAGVLAVIPAGLHALIASRHGFPLANRTLVAVLTVNALLLQLWALWLSYSRGGMLALLAASAIGLTLAYAPAGVLTRVMRWAPRIAALVLCAGVGMMLFHTATPVVEAQGVTRAGQDVSFNDLTNPESFELRLGYWQVALRIFADNWLGGVGLGAFKWAYPAYQFVGAGNVQEAHNSFLQALAETGILGGLALAAFWIVLLLWGLQRISIETDPPTRRLLLGLYTGLLAFLLHSAIDINFAHPTLMFFAMLFAGLLTVTAGEGERPAFAERLRLPVLVLVLLGATFAMGMSTRPWFQNLVLSRMQFIGGDAQDVLMQRFDIARYVLVGAPDARMNNRPMSPVTIRALSLFDVDLARMIEYSTVYEPDPATGKPRRSDVGASVTADSMLVFTKPWLASDQFQKDSQSWLEELKREDARYPYDPQLSMHLSNWYQLLVHLPDRPWLKEDPEAWYGPLMEWSNETIERNPLNSDGYLNKSRSELYLWNRNQEDLAHLQEAVAMRRKAAELAPAQAVFQYHVADLLYELAQRLEKQGDAAGAKEAMDEELAARQKAWEILRHGLPPKPMPEPVRPKGEYMP